MTARYVCRKILGRWVISFRDGQAFFTTDRYQDALAILRTIHDRRIKTK